MTRANRIRLLIFVILGSLAVIYAGTNYARLTERFLPTGYRVTVDLRESGGLFPRSEVTFRGVTVGRVEDLEFRTDGVRATLRLGNDWRIPADLTAEVHNRSAIGEQYLDLVPSRDTGPFLHDGSRIGPEATTTPIDDQELIVAADELFRSIPTRDLRTLVDESADAFGGAGSDLGRVIDNSATLVRAAEEALPATLSLLRDGRIVLSTQVRQLRTIGDYLADLRTVSGVLADRDGAVRTVLIDGTEAARQLRLLARGISPNLPRLLTNIIDLSALLGDRRDELEETLVALPWALASAQTPGRDGRAHFTFVGAADPQPCRTGYIPAESWQSPNDLTPSRLPATLGCRTPASVPRGVTR